MDRFRGLDVLEELLCKQLSLLEEATHLNQEIFATYEAEERRQRNLRLLHSVKELPAPLSSLSSVCRTPREERDAALLGSLVFSTSLTPRPDGEHDEALKDDEPLAQAASGAASAPVSRSVAASAPGQPAGEAKPSLYLNIRSAPPKPQSPLLQPLLLPERDEAAAFEQMHTSERSPATSTADDRKRHPRHTLREETAIRNKLKEVLQHHSDEDVLYRKHGMCQAIVRNLAFQITTLVVILLNVVWLWIDTDYNKAEILIEAPPIFVVVNNLFCVYFVFEICVRMGAHAQRFKGFFKPVFMFDLFLCMTMVWETWVQVALYVLSGRPHLDVSGAQALRVLRLFRLTRVTRVARMARLVRLFPELMILVKGMAAGMRSVAAILLLLFIIVYIFGIIFTQLDTFPSVPEAMEALLIQVLCGFDTSFVKGMLRSGVDCFIIFLVYILLASFNLMNMLIGFLCTVVSEVADNNKEERLVEAFDTEVDRIAETLGLDWRGFTVNDLERLRHHPELCKGMIDLGVDFITFVNLLTLFLTDADESLSRDDIKQLLSHCRASKPVTVKDLVDHQHFVHLELAGINSSVDKLWEHLLTNDCPMERGCS